MGTIRLLLALSVVIHHMAPVPMVLVGGAPAVRLFYTISGFFMALILNEKYTGVGSTSLFYSNRVLRLFPAYYAALLFPIICSIAISAARGTPYFHMQLLVLARAWPDLSTIAGALLILSHISLLGQDLFWIVEWYIPGSQFVVLPADSGASFIPGYYFLVNPPAWTISMELWFYLVAPWIVRSSWRVQGLLAATGFSLIFGLPLLGATSGFWQRQFLPTQLPFFICGSLAYAGYRTLRAAGRDRWLGHVGRWGWAACLLLLCIYPYLAEQSREALATLILVSALPGVFHVSRQVSWDRFIGELSYPVYVMHWNLQPFAVVGGAFLFGGKPAPGWVLVVLAVSLSLAAAVAIHWFIDRPVDRWRQRRVAATSESR